MVVALSKVGAGLHIRLEVEESPEFEKAEEEGELAKIPLVEVVRSDWRNLLRGFGATRRTEVAAATRAAEQDEARTAPAAG